MADERQSRVRCNIERTASGKVTRAVTFEHFLAEPVSPDETQATVDEAIRLFTYAESQLRTQGVTE